MKKSILAMATLATTLAAFVAAPTFAAAPDVKTHTKKAAHARHTSGAKSVTHENPMGGSTTVSGRAGHTAGSSAGIFTRKASEREAQPSAPARR